MREVALTYGGTNIPLDPNSPIEDGGEPFLSEDAAIEDIEKALAELPRDMFFEIWGAVGDAYPYWGPVNDPKAPPEEKTSPSPNEPKLP